MFFFVVCFLFLVFTQCFLFWRLPRLFFLFFRRLLRFNVHERQMREGVPFFGSVFWRPAWSLTWSWSLAPWLSWSPSGLVPFPVVGFCSGAHGLCSFGPCCLVSFCFRRMVSDLVLVSDSLTAFVPVPSSCLSWFSLHSSLTVLVRSLLSVLFHCLCLSVWLPRCFCGCCGPRAVFD